VVELPLSENLPVESEESEMAEPTLSEIFGATSSQTAASLTINKSDLSVTGLVPSSTNTPESLLVALIIYASRSLTETNRSSDTVNRNVTVNYSGQDLVNGSGGAFYRRDIYSALLYKSTTIATIDPGDY
jgi:hypothetical protein